MTINILRGNTVIREVPIAESDRIVCKLMEEEYAELNFSVLTPVYFEIGDYIDLAASAYDGMCPFEYLRKRYVVTSRQVPTYNATTGAYDWKLRLNAFYFAWDNRIFKFRPDRCSQEASWGLTDKVTTFLEIYRRNLVAYGFGDESDIQVDVQDDIASRNINVSFQGNKMIEALKMICSKVNEDYNDECEWWITQDGGKTIIHMGRCELSMGDIDPVITNEGDACNAEGIEPEDTDQQYANRLVVFGGTQNLSARYRKSLYFQVSEATQQEGGILIRDNIKTNLSPKWFKTTERVYKDAINVTASTSIVSGYIKEDTQRITERNRRDFSYTREIGKVTPNNTMQLFTYDISAEVSVHDYNVVTGGFPFKESKGPAYKMSSVKARLYVERGGVSYDLAEAAGTGKELAEISIQGSRYVVSTDFTEGEWSIKLEFSMNLDGTISEQQAGHENDQSFPIWGNIYAFYNTESASITLTSDDVYRVDTTIKIGGNTYQCTVNPGTDDLSSDEARDILVKNATGIQAGDIFEFPTIVRGKASVGYFTSDQQDTIVNGIVNRNLMLPQQFSIYYGEDGQIRKAQEGDSQARVKAYTNKNYIDIVKGLTDAQVVEQMETYEKIYPKQQFRIFATGYYTSETEEEDSSGTDIGFTEGTLTKTHYHWQFMMKPEGSDATDIGFTEDCLIENENLGITFDQDESVKSKLSGLTFDVAWSPNHDTFPDSDEGDGERWEIVNSDSYGLEMPNSSIYPVVGDKVILTGWNIEALEGLSSLITDAEERLLDEAIKQCNRIIKDPHSYRITMMSGWVRDNYLPLRQGQRVKLENSYIFRNGSREARIIGYEVKLDIQHDSPVILAGERPEYSNISKAKERLDAIDQGDISATPIVSNS